MAMTATEHTKNYAEILWEHKKREVEQAGIELMGEMDFTTVDNLNSNESIYFATIIGILTDNAKEYLIKNRQLSQRIEVTGNEDKGYWITNAIAAEEVKQIKKFTQRGFTTKVNDSKAGYGLCNALQYSEMIGRKLIVDYLAEADAISFGLVLEPSEAVK